MNNADSNTSSSVIPRKTHLVVNGVVVFFLVLLFLYLDAQPCYGGLAIGVCGLGDLLSRIFFISYALLFIASTTLIRRLFINKGWLEGHSFKQFVFIYLGIFLVLIPLTVLTTFIIVYLGDVYFDAW